MEQQNSVLEHNSSRDSAEQKAQFFLESLEQQISVIKAQSNYLLDILLDGKTNTSTKSTLDHPMGLSGISAAVTLSDIEDYAPQWSKLIKGEQHELKIALAVLLARKYLVSPLKLSNICISLNLDQPETKQASWNLYNQSVEELLTVEEELTQSADLEIPETVALRLLRDQLELVSFLRGEAVFKQGDEVEALYLIISGRLRPSVKDEQGAERFLTDRGPGEIIGEIALITGDKLSATFHALCDTLLLKLSKEGFMRLSESYPQITLHLATLAIKQLNLEMSGKKVSAPPKTIAIVPLSKDVPITEFVAKLVEILSGYSSVLHLNSVLLNRYLGHIYPEGDLSRALENRSEAGPIVAWLNEQDLKYHFVLYETDKMDSPWTRRCLRQAERVIIVGMAEANPGPGEIESKLFYQNFKWMSNRQDLVLLHSSHNSTPAITARWLAHRKINRHYHVCLENRSDMERLARGLSGNTFGLVLGGGGARGFTHIGVIRALQEANIPIDIVGGTSAGSLVAALFATGMDHVEMQEGASVMFSAFNDFTLPLISVIAGRNFHTTLKTLFGNREIEDLWLEFFCVSSNLTRAQMMVHRQGLLHKSVRASCSIPGVFPPVSYRGDLLIDGAIMNNVPTDVMYELSGSGTIIVVDITDETPRRGNYVYKDGMSGWELLWNKLSPWNINKVKMPGIVEILSRSTLLSIRSSSKRKASLYLTPPVEAFSMFDLKNCDKLIEIGYQYTQVKIAEWQKSQPIQNNFSF